MPVQRMRMRSWLEERIDSQTVAGLEWVSKEDKMFSIPWKHAARHGWEVDKDACLFKQWAIHTGKFKEGQTADPKTWKANFRCAMNSLPDIEEVKNRSVNKGCAAMRVYRMLPLQPKRKNKRIRSRDTRRSSSGKASWQSSEDQMMQENKVDSTRDDNSPYTHVPDVAGFDVEIGPDNTHSFTNRFQVSPVHSTDLEENEDEIIIELTRQLEQDTMQWQPNNVFGKGFLSNEGSTSVSLSPDSQWSTSSGDELELRLYTELNSDPVDDLFNGNTWTTSTSLMPL